MTTDTPRTDAAALEQPDGLLIVHADFARTLERDLSAMRERVVKYRARLEVDHHAEDFGGTLERVDLPFDEDEPYDGIDCRDETIRLLDQARDEMRTDLAECRAALAELVACKDLKDHMAAYLQNGTSGEYQDARYEYERRKPLAWSTARALATKDKEPQPAAKEG